jgi:hypothetical protein
MQLRLTDLSVPSATAGSFDDAKFLHCSALRSIPNIYLILLSKLTPLPFLKFQSRVY